MKINVIRRMNLASEISANSVLYIFLGKLSKFLQAGNIHESKVAKLLYIFSLPVYLNSCLIFRICSLSGSTKAFLPCG